mmetsp:Transcript_28316/g.32554  ORF Transcript_28316/g.32554 Transcript_28316/m.32554 type:complete len:187 (-) Transcript_28316:125-685(-)
MKQYGSDDDIEKRIGLSRKDHENRIMLNELPKGKITPSVDDPTIWKDEDGRPWKLNPDEIAVYHQPTNIVSAEIRAFVGKVIPSIRNPNLKFISPNADGRYSEVCANRYTGELVIEQQLIGTFNFAADAPNAMKDAKYPAHGEHERLDVTPHNEYGGKYKHIARDIPIGSLEKGPVILGLLEEEPV